MKLKHKSIKREFDTDKSEAKLRALHLWKAGESISEIAKICGVSRDTIYRWLKNINRKLRAPQSRSRKSVDEVSRFRILETYFILKGPAIPHLKRVLESQFHIMLSISQLRRLLKKWKVYEYSSSSFHDSLIRYQFERVNSLGIENDEGPAEEIAEKSIERSLPRGRASLPISEEAAFVEAP